MEPRIAASVLAGGLIRKAEGEGGFGTVIAKGDPTAGSILVILLERGANPRLFERLLQPNGRYSWKQSGGPAANPDDVPGFIAKRRRFDPDLWVIELDIPSAERFAAEMNALD
ncbi:MAG TPA: DUF1491 family protein [Allosphingosinicella sp.]|nr:DUF1491 family protein [Allosphingosinicella sp.]